MDNSVYWIWLQQALGYANYKVKIVYELFEGKIDEFYNSGENGWRLCGCFTNSQIKSLMETSLDLAYSILRRCESLGYEVISIDDKSYPKILREISDPPAVLYALGDKTCLEENIMISVIGAREASYDGKNTAREMASEIAMSGAIVVSGGALGIDAEAHRGAIEVGMKTIAVLGTGINDGYLVANSGLRDKISRCGVLISEYPPDYPAYPRNFPKRNRIISGLSQATIIVEAGKKSGTLITANYANEQGRDVFVAPVDLRSPLSLGIVSLINDGVKVIADVKGLVESYKLKMKQKALPEIKLNFQKSFESKEHDDFDIDTKPKRVAPNPKLELVSESAKKVYKILENGKMDVNNICEKSGMETKIILASLTELEIYGLIRNITGRVYEIS